MTRRTVLLCLILIASACSGGEATTTTTALTTTSTNAVAPTTTVVASGPLTVARTRTSAEIDGFGSGNAVDGDTATWWSAGDGPPQWIEFDFGAAVTITAVQLTVSQDPAGATTHRFVSEDVELLTITRDTADLGVVEVIPDTPWTAVTTLRIETIDSPSWVAWREVEFSGVVTGEAPPPPEAADVVFHGGTILTLTGDGTAEAVAVTDDVIVAVGAASEILTLVGPDTRVVDLAGRTLMPGFVDPHTHLLSDAGMEMLDAEAVAFANGITTISDASVEPELLDRYLAVADDLAIRVGVYLGRTDYCGGDMGTWYEEYPPGTAFNDRLFVAGIKVFSDGGACGVLASSEPFIDGVEIGPPFHDPAFLEEMIRTASDAGYQVVVHAQGDLAIRDAQDAIEVVLEGGDNLLRHRIDHNSIVTDDLLARYGEIGIVPVVFGTFPTCADVAWTDFWKDNGEDWRAFLDANPGLPVAWHGDDPSLPPISPLLDLASYVTRAGVRDDGSLCEPEPWLAATRITASEGLRMMTIDAAYALGVDDIVGSIEVGKRADLIVVTADPLAADPLDLFDIEVVTTFVDGRSVFCRAGDEAFCG